MASQARIPLPSLVLINKQREHREVTAEGWGEGGQGGKKRDRRGMERGEERQGAKADNKSSELGTVRTRAFQPDRGRAPQLRARVAELFPLSHRVVTWLEEDTS